MVLDVCVQRMCPDTLVRASGDVHERLFVASGPDRQWFVGDALGSVRLVLDEAGTPLSTQRYNPWGVPASGPPAPFSFTGSCTRGSERPLRPHQRHRAPRRGRRRLRPRALRNIGQPLPLVKDDQPPRLQPQPGQVVIQLR